MQENCPDYTILEETMISALHLLWIVPLSAAAGAVAVILPQLLRSFADYDPYAIY